MDTNDAFAPARKATRLVATTNASARLALPLNDQVRLVPGGVDCRVEFGDATVTATAPVVGGAAGSTMLKAGSVEVFSVPPGTTHVAYATDTGTGTLELTPGVGL